MENKCFKGIQRGRGGEVKILLSRSRGRKKAVRLAGLFPTEPFFLAEACWVFASHSCLTRSGLWRRDG